MKITGYVVNGVLRQWWDHSGRTYHEYDDIGVETLSRPYTEAENAAADAAAAAEAARTVEATLAADTRADLAKIAASIEALRVLLDADTVVGSYRNIIGPSGAAAGTGNLRAIAAQTNTNVTSAASIKALIKAVIDLAQLDINAAQADRRIARQTLRLARDMVGDYSSADVGAP